MFGNENDVPLIRDAAEFRAAGDGLFEVVRDGRTRGYIPAAILQCVANNALRALRDWHETIESEKVVPMRKRAGSRFRAETHD